MFANISFENAGPYKFVDGFGEDEGDISGTN